MKEDDGSNSIGYTAVEDAYTIHGENKDVKADVGSNSISYTAVEDAYMNHGEKKDVKADNRI